MPVQPTPSQTVGPFFSLGLSWMGAHELVDPSQPGAIVLFGRVLDGAAAPVPDAVIEIFHADPEGRFPRATHDGWTGFGRALTDGDGAYRFVTSKPGPLGENEANRQDSVLRSIDDEAVRASLWAHREGDGLRFDIRLQGDGETGFFAW